MKQLGLACHTFQEDHGAFPRGGNWDPDPVATGDWNGDKGSWLVRILPTLASSGEPAYLRGTGMTTNIVFVQDLALWVPLMAVASSRSPA